jgi:hypothetical protein
VVDHRIFIVNKTVGRNGRERLCEHVVSDPWASEGVERLGRFSSSRERRQCGTHAVPSIEDGDSDVGKGGCDILPDCVQGSEETLVDQPWNIVARSVRNVEVRQPVSEVIGTTKHQGSKGRPLEGLNEESFGTLMFRIEEGNLTQANLGKKVRAARLRQEGAFLDIVAIHKSA